MSTFRQCAMYKESYIAENKTEYNEGVYFLFIGFSNILFKLTSFHIDKEKFCIIYHRFKIIILKGLN